MQQVLPAYSCSAPPATGDCILGLLGVKPTEAASVLTPPVQESPPPLRVDIPPLHLPNDFQERVRALPSNTMLHVPQICRLRMIATIALLEGAHRRPG